ncbi:MAG: hypothetical protein MJE68_10610 [Proteobacteria bacterium]|nr:hypothetical protein [Pseudomonadota bacterium]
MPEAKFTKTTKKYRCSPYSKWYINVRANTQKAAHHGQILAHQLNPQQKSVL